MKKRSSRSTAARALASRLALGCAWLATACSGYYPLGETSEAGQLLGSDAATAPTEVADSRVAPSLAPPDVTMNGAETMLVTSVGDLDGDGRDEMAFAAVDFATRTSFVQLRYGVPKITDLEQVFAFERSGAHLALANEMYSLLSASSAGDLDGDGYGDLLIRTYDCDTTRPEEGAYVVYGGPERLEGTLPLGSVAAHFAPPSRSAAPPPGYGETCSYAQTIRAGDLDGDGFDDLVLNYAPQNDSTNGLPLLDTGEGLYVFYGRRERFSGTVPFTAADASFRAGDWVNTFPLGDVNGDGRADLLVAPLLPLDIAAIPGSFLLRGRAERWSGPLDVSANATLLEGAIMMAPASGHQPADFDGDGLHDLIIQTPESAYSLFYGSPDLFSDGFDFAASDAQVSAGRTIFSAGDRDADGDDELLDMFTNPANSDTSFSFIFTHNVALASGSAERFAGDVMFPEGDIIARSPNGLFGETQARDGSSGRALESTIPAGDLDGDGAEDLLTTSYIFEITRNDTYDMSSHQVHIHYGAPAPVEPTLR